MTQTTRATGFLVTLVVDLPDRVGLLVSGQPQQGRLWPGMVLNDESGRGLRILQLEFPSPQDIRTGEYTAMLERGEPNAVRPGVLLRTAGEHAG